MINVELCVFLWDLTTVGTGQDRNLSQQRKRRRKKRYAQATERTPTQASVLMEISKKNRNIIILIKQEGQCHHVQMVKLVSSKELGRCKYIGVH